MRLAESARGIPATNLGTDCVRWNLAVGDDPKSVGAKTARRLSAPHDFDSCNSFAKPKIVIWNLIFRDLLLHNWQLSMMSIVFCELLLFWIRVVGFKFQQCQWRWAKKLSNNYFVFLFNFFRDFLSLHSVTYDSYAMHC